MQADPVVITSGTSFAISARSGDINLQTEQGFYAHDTRFLSMFRVSIGSRLPAPVKGERLNHSSASFYSVNQGSRTLPRGAVSVVRDRYVVEGLHEDIHLMNHLSTEVQLHLELTFESDFADVFEVRRGRFSKAGHIHVARESEHDIAFVYRRDHFERQTWIDFNPAPTSINGRTAVFDLTLKPKEHWKACVGVTPVVEGTVPRPMKCVGSVLGSPFGAYRFTGRQPLSVEPGGSRRPLKEVPTLDTPRRDLAAIFEAAVADLRSLQLPQPGDRHILAAGLPWFMAVFGRDAIISAIQTKILGPDLMLGTLYTLASLQAKEKDEFRDAEPGKIPHEIREGELSVLAELPHSRYYGTVDATPLFLRLLWNAYQWTGDQRLLRDLLPAAEAALGWLDNFGDLDGDGFIEYRRRRRTGLRNQGWKDSEDSVSYASGALAAGAIALAEVQGYAYDARRCMAQIYRVLGQSERSAALEQQAEALKRAFNDAFWMPREGFYAIALDGRKQQVDSIASNIGHCLWSGIIDEERAPQVVERLLAPDMFSGWGIRTLSVEMERYSPLSYHNGSVWPHDNSLIANGLAAYGFGREAEIVAGAVLEAALHFPDRRLPELFAGYPRREHSFPVPYPAANVPQAWACGAVIYFLETLLGLQVQGDRLVPRFQRSDLRVEGLPFRGMRLTV